MWQQLLLSLCLAIAEAILKGAINLGQDLQDKAKKDALDKENAEAYLASQDRLERIKNAKNLLNGTRP